MTPLLIMIGIVGLMILLSYLYDRRKSKRVDIDSDQVNKRFDDL